MNSNLIRKRFRTTLIKKARKGKCLELLSKVDAHSTTIAETIYCTTTPAEDAKLGKYLFEEVCGDPVPWPVQQKSHALSADALVEAWKGTALEVDLQEPLSEGGDEEDLPLFLAEGQSLPHPGHEDEDLVHQDLGLKVLQDKEATGSVPDELPGPNMGTAKQEAPPPCRTHRSSLMSKRERPMQGGGLAHSTRNTRIGSHQKCMPGGQDP